MSNVSAVDTASDGKVDARAGEPTTRRDRDLREAMTATSATATRARTGGPRDDGPAVLEHVLGWTLVVVLAMLVTQLGLL